MDTRAEFFGFVAPANAGVQVKHRESFEMLDSRVRGNDGAV